MQKRFFHSVVWLSTLYSQTKLSVSTGPWGLKQSSISQSALQFCPSAGPVRSEPARSLQIKTSKLLHSNKTAAGGSERDGLDSHRRGGNVTNSSRIRTSNLWVSRTEPNPNLHRSRVTQNQSSCFQQILRFTQIIKTFLMQKEEFYMEAHSCH